VIFLIVKVNIRFKSKLIHTLSTSCE